MSPTTGKGHFYFRMDFNPFSQVKGNKGII